MVSYNPLWKTLIDRGMLKTDLMHPDIGISSATLAKMGKGEYVALTILEKICLALDCPIEAVVEIKKA